MRVFNFTLNYYCFDKLHEFYGMVTLDKVALRGYLESFPLLLIHGEYNAEEKTFLFWLLLENAPLFFCFQNVKLLKEITGFCSDLDSIIPVFQFPHKSNPAKVSMNLVEEEPSEILEIYEQELNGLKYNLELISTGFNDYYDLVKQF